jgi:hypothetical protein
VATENPDKNKDIPEIDATEEEWAVFPGGPHEARTWMRFVPTSTFDDPWVVARNESGPRY